MKIKTDPDEITGNPPQQFPFFKNQNTLVYLGTSMSPTLDELDIIEFSPYTDSHPRKGDVIIIQRHEEPERLIIHRIVMVSSQGIRTQGDNCAMMDPWILSLSEILGRVTSARRKNTIIRIHRGYFGFLKFIYLRTIARVLRICKAVARHPYQWFTDRKLPSRLISPFLSCRMITFSGSDRSETHLFLGPVCIGRLQKGTGIWEIKAPYRLLIDPTLFPFPEKEKDQDISGKLS
jgi:signal peptidase I